MMNIRKGRSSMIEDYEIPGFIRDPKARTLSYFAKHGSVSIHAGNIAALKRRSIMDQATARLCLHNGPDSPLHEMIIAQPRGKFYPPKKNLIKPKSFTILDGILAVFVFEDGGRITERYILDGVTKMCRIDPGKWHCDISVSETAIHLEVIPGPFTGIQEHVMAPWSPKLDDEAALAAYHAELMKEIRF